MTRIILIPEMKEMSWNSKKTSRNSINSDSIYRIYARIEIKCIGIIISFSEMIRNNAIQYL
jgi:hypothetical protein